MHIERPANVYTIQLNLIGRLTTYKPLNNPATN